LFQDGNGPAPGDMCATDLTCKLMHHVLLRDVDVRQQQPA
jgi:hypothetical protein